MLRRLFHSHGWGGAGMIWIPIVVVVVIIAVFVVIFRSSLTNVIAGGRLRPDTNTEQANIGTSTIIIGAWVVGFGLLGLIALVIWSFAQDKAGQETIGWQMLGTTALIAVASASVGALLGFIFGIPRTLDPASRVAVASAAVQAGPVASSQAALAANTNLERISDWLTTLLIGATLVQVGNVLTWVGSLGDKLKDGVTIQALTPIIVVYYFALAFLGTYLITRLYLTFALQQTLALLTGVAGPKIAVPSMPDGRVGAAYPATAVTASGGMAPLRWMAQRLPPGLGIDSGSGVISGTPTAAAAKDKYIIVVIDSAAPPNSDAETIEIEIH
jgi:hypothetical protein